MTIPRKPHRDIHDCWFCGSVDLMADYYEVESPWRWVICRTCGARGPITKNTDEAIKRWNSINVEIRDA